MYEFLMFTASIILFTQIDVIGYWYILKGDASHPYWENKEYNEPNKLGYRIIQLILQLAIFGGLWILVSDFVAILWIIIHFFGVHDYLYYIFVNRYKAMKSNNDMFWLWWTIFGAISKDLRNGKSLERFAIASYIVSGIIILVV